MVEPRDPFLWELITEDKETLDELKAGPDRSLAIIGGATLEAALHEALSRALIDDSDVFERLFGVNGQVPAFEPKIRAGYLFGLYSRAIYRDLIKIAKVRNHFAHARKTASFTDQPVREHCRDIGCVDTFTIDDSAADAPNGSDWLEYSVRERMFRVMLTERDSRLRQPKERYAVAILVIETVLRLFRPARPPDPTF